MQVLLYYLQTISSLKGACVNAQNILLLLALTYKCSTYPFIRAEFYLERDLPCLSILLSKASYSVELASLLDSGLLSVIETRWQRPDLLHQAADIVDMYRNSVRSNLHIRLSNIVHQQPQSSARPYAALHADNSDAFASDGALKHSTADSSMHTFKSFREPAAIRETSKGRYIGLTPAHPKIRKTQGA